jgi:hypothetical protein
MGLIGSPGLPGANGPDGPAGLAGQPGPRGHTFEVLDSADQVVGRFMFTDANSGTTTVARTTGAHIYSLLVHATVPIAEMNAVSIYFRGTTCEGTALTSDSVAYGSVLPPPAAFGPANEVFAADMRMPIVAVGGWTATDACTSAEDVSTLYLWNGSTSSCSAVSLCGPMRPLISMGTVNTTPPYALRIP